MALGIKLSIDVLKIDKSLLREHVGHGGQKMMFLDLVAWESKGQGTQYGDFSVKQDTPKDQRDRQMPFIGNGRKIGHDWESTGHPSSQQSDRGGSQAQQSFAGEGDDEIPF